MEKTTFVITDYCILHQIQPEFIYALVSEGIIEITDTAGETSIEDDDLHRLEVFTRLHSQLGINAEGIDAISNLLEKMRQMQDELQRLQARLGIYEGGSGAKNQ